MADKTINHNHPKPLLEGVVLDYNRFSTELSNAAMALGELQGSHEELRNPSLLIAPLMAKEAEVSSRIEGTMSTVSDVFRFDAGAPTDREQDTRQVSNYKKAMRWGLSEMKKGREINSTLVKGMHRLLLDGVRHSGPLGDFRDDVVFIGQSETDKIENALYVPPEPIHVMSYMDDFFSYINTGDENTLVKAGIAHYQFEAVHPFGDGNGRVGRLLIPLILCVEGKLTSPILYLSGYFDEHKEEYIAALRDTDASKDMNIWIKFFLGSVSEQLKETQRLINSIKQLYKDTQFKFIDTKSPYTSRFIDFMFEMPSFTIPQVQSHLNCSSLTARTLVKDFVASSDVYDVQVRIGHAKLYTFLPLINLL